MAGSGPSDLDLLTRFTCFGSEEGTVNVLSKGDYSKECVLSIESILSSNKGLDAIKRLKAISEQKCYIRKECLLYVLARIVREASPQEKGNNKEDLLRKEAYSLAQELCDSSSNLFTFVHFDKQAATPPKTSWGRGMRNLISQWYYGKSPLDLAKEVTRSKSGHGWSHKDLISQVHLNSKSKSEGFAAVVGYLMKGKAELERVKATEDQEVQGVVAVMEAVERLKASQEVEGDVIRTLIEMNRLTDKQIPTHFYRFRESYEGQIAHMSLADVFRNLPKMAEFSMLEQRSPTIGRIVERIQNVEAVKQERISPVTIFIALRKYDMNRAKRWTRNPFVVKLLHLAYSAALEVAPKLGKRILLAVHLDAKILKSHVSGANVLTSIMPCAMVAQMLSRAEENFSFAYFNTTKISELKVTEAMTTVAVIEQIVNETKDQGNQIFDMSNALEHYGKEGKAFDCMLIMSDKKTVSTPQAFHQAVAQYRTQCNVPHAKVAVVGLNDAASLGNRDDLNFLDVTGFNAEVPTLLHHFFQGLPYSDAAV